MVGGLLNLIAEGEEDIMLIGNPTKNFFKKTFKRYNNFGRQKFRINMEGRTRLNLHSKSTYTFKIPRYGDFLQDTHLCLNLPNIWSPILSNQIQLAMCASCRTGIETIPNQLTNLFTMASTTELPDPQGGASKPTTCWACGEGCTSIYHFNLSQTADFRSKINFNFPYEFKWIKELGFMIIDRITVNANSVKLQEYTGQYLSNMVKRDFVEEQQNLINKMIGNTADLNDPANYRNRRGNYPNAAYFGSMNDRMKYGLEPSIRGKKLYIPLNILGTLLSKTAVPLVSMQYSELNIQITLKPVYDWFVVKNMNFLKTQLTVPPIKKAAGNYWIPISPTNAPGGAGTVLDSPDTIIDCFKKTFNIFATTFIKPDCNYEIYQMGIFLKEPPPKLCVPGTGGGDPIPTVPCKTYLGEAEAGTIVVPFPNEEVAAYYGLSDDVDQSQLKYWFSDVHLIANYTFIEDTARDELANNCQSMLIRTIHEYDVYDLVGQQNTVLESNGLVINWMWFFQRSDAYKRNEWNNYSNFKYVGEPFETFNSFREEPVRMLCYSQCPNRGELSQLYWTSNYTEEAIKDIMLDWGFNLNTTVREINTVSAVTAYVDLYSRSNGEGNDGCYYYTFSLNTDPFIYQPSGAINLSKFNTLTWNYNLLTPPAIGTNPYIDTLGRFYDSLLDINYDPNNPPPPSQMVPNSVTCDPDNPKEPITSIKNTGRLYEYTYTLHIMEERLNILVIENGIAGLALSN
tara:strand:- start:203 stop:2419 length:2217 start_codon:yes stop_codon:yes gene_type:complete